MAIQTINLGTLSSTPTPVQHHSVSPSEPYDIYRFRLDSPGNINLSLTGMSANADVALYRDVNNNGVIDSSDSLIQRSTSGGYHDEVINVAAQAGNYLARVYSYQNTNSTSYDLRLSTTPSQAPSNLLPMEFRVGDDSWSSLNQDKTFSGSIGGSNTVDTYFFYLARPSGFPFGSDTASITLSGLSNDADIRLINDANGNHIVDAGEVVALSTNGGSTNEFIGNIGAGNYYLQVYQYSGDTNYTLNFDYTYVPPA